MCKKTRRKIIKNSVVALSVSLGLYCAVSIMQPTPVFANDTPIAKTMNVSEIVYTGNTSMSDGQIGFLLPELKKGHVDVAVLSRQIQLANNSGAVNLAVDFSVNNSGQTVATVTVKELKNQSTSLTVNNTGNKWTGDYRTIFTYINSNLSGKADTFGTSLITSPNHVDDVKQGVLFYRMLLPQANDSLYLLYSCSDVNMGRIADFGVFGIDSSGKGYNYGLHYQKNLDYQPAHHSVVDFGVENSRYDNTTLLTGGTLSADVGTGSVGTTMLSATYSNTERSQNDILAYSIGYAYNVGGSTADYDRLERDKSFGVIKYGVNYQHQYQNDWIVNAKVNGQYTNNNLIGQAKLGEGGASTVRGFADQVVQGDKGVDASLEFYTPKIAEGQRLLVFADYAHLANNTPQTGELTNANLASVGLGWRYDGQTGWSALLDYGFVVNGKEYNVNHDHGRLHAAITKRF